MKISGLDLFSGIGGIALALSPWVEVKAYCEIDLHCQKLLSQNMNGGLLDKAPIYTDVTKLKGKDLEQQIDIITGGFPCQDISVAGHGAGLAGERSGLFYQVVRLASELRPSFIFLENVPAITTRGGATVITELTKGGYECRWTTLSARAVGANHKRERWWLLAKRVTTNPRCEQKGASQDLQPPGEEPERAHSTDLCQMLPHASSEGLERQWQPQRVHAEHPSSFHSCWWATEPNVARVAHGVPHRVDRIKALGNAVVPLQARIAFNYLLTSQAPPP